MKGLCSWLLWAFYLVAGEGEISDVECRMWLEPTGFKRPPHSYATYLRCSFSRLFRRASTLFMYRNRLIHTTSGGTAANIFQVSILIPQRLRKNGRANVHLVEPDRRDEYENEHGQNH